MTSVSVTTTHNTPTLDTIKAKKYQITVSPFPFRSYYNVTIDEVWIPEPYRIYVNQEQSWDNPLEGNIFEPTEGMDRLNEAQHCIEIEVSKEWADACLKILHLRNQLNREWQVASNIVLGNPFPPTTNSSGATVVTTTSSAAADTSDAFIGDQMTRVSQRSL